MPWKKISRKDVQVGDIASHVSGLDPRAVAEVTADGKYIRIWLLDSVSASWFPVRNYTFQRYEEV